LQSLGLQIVEHSSHGDLNAFLLEDALDLPPLNECMNSLQSDLVKTWQSKYEAQFLHLLNLNSE
jgi:hypothetical protein